jgi:hypothetical protein
VGTREGLRVIATLMGGGFLVYAVLAVVRGTLHDVDDGRVDRSARPVTFWLLVGARTEAGSNGASSSTPLRLFAPRA